MTTYAMVVNFVPHDLMWSKNAIPDINHNNHHVLWDITWVIRFNLVNAEILKGIVEKIG